MNRTQSHNLLFLNSLFHRCLLAGARPPLVRSANFWIIFFSLLAVPAFTHAQAPQQTAAIPDVVAANPIVSQYPEAFVLNPATHAVYVLSENDPDGGFTGSLLYIDGSQPTPVADPASACPNNNEYTILGVYTPSNSLFFPVASSSSSNAYANNLSEVSGTVGSCPPNPSTDSFPIAVSGETGLLEEEAPGVATDPALGKLYAAVQLSAPNGTMLPQLAIFDLSTSTFESYAPPLYGNPGNPYALAGTLSSMALDDAGPNPSHLVFIAQGDTGQNNYTQLIVIDPTGSVAKEATIPGFSGIPFVLPSATSTSSGQLAVVSPTQINVFNISDLAAYVAGGAIPSPVGSGTFNASLLGTSPSSVTFTEPVLDSINGVVYGDLSGQIAGNLLPAAILLSVSIAGLPSGANSTTPVGVSVGALDLFDQSGAQYGSAYPYTLALTVNPADSQHPFVYAISVGDYSGNADDPNLSGIQLFNTATSTVSTIPLTAPCALGTTSPLCPLKPQGVDFTGYSSVFITDPGNNNVYLRGVLTDSETREPDYYIAVVQIPAGEPILGPPASISVVSGSGQTSVQGTAFANPLMVLVTDANSNPLPSVAVTFSGSGVSFSNSGMATTNTAGDAQITATPTATGSLTASATVSGVSSQATFTLTGTTATIPATAAPVFGPVAGIYASAQSVTITDATQNAVIYYTTDGSTPTKSSTVYGSAIPVTSSETIQAVAQAPGDSLSSVASASYAINLPAQISLTPGIISTWLSNTAHGSVLGSVVIDSSANVYVLDSGLGSITRYDPTGLNPTVIVAAANSPFLNPSDMAIGIDGLTLYVSDYGNNRIVAVNTANSAVTPLTLQGIPAPATLNAPTGIAAGGPNGNVYISDAGNGRVLELTTSGQFVSVVTSAGGNSPLAEPLGLAVDPKGDVFIANDVPKAAGNILEVVGGTITPIADSSIVAPYGLAIDAAGDVYFSDQSLQIVGKLDPSGAVTIVAGNSSSSGDSGDGGPATAASLLSPLGLALDALNDIFIADSMETGAGGSVRLVTVGTGALAFASQANNVASAAQTLTVSNTGGSTLMVNELGALSGVNPKDFAIAGGETTGCATGAAFSLGTGVSCTLVVTFTPSVTGVESAVLTFNDNAGNGTQIATFTGTGLPPPTLIATTTDLSGPTTLAYGTTGAFTVTVTAASGTATPVGSIAYTVTSGSATAGSGNVTLANGTVSVPINGLAPGAYTISASYAPASGSGFASSQGVAMFTVSRLGTTTALTATPTSGAYGTSIALAATVKASSGNAVPAGNVTFTSGTTVLGSAALNNSGVATYANSSLTVGADAITAKYAGNIDFAGSTSAATSVTISPITTTTTLASSSATAAAGANVTFAATVAASSGIAPPSGTVTFDDGGTLLGSGTLDFFGTVTYSTSSLAVGTHTITASYAGDSIHAASTSSTFIETIDAVVTAGWSVVVKPQSLTIAQGQTGTAVFTVTSIGGYSQPVSFSCGELPAYATCAFDPPVVVPTSSGVTTTWSMKTNQVLALTHPFPVRPTNSGPSGSSIFLAGTGFAGFVLLLGLRKRRHLLGRFRFSVLFLMFALAGTLVSFVFGCGSSGPITPIGTDTVTISATSGSGSAAINQTVTLQVTITQ